MREDLYLKVDEAAQQFATAIKETGLESPVIFWNARDGEEYISGDAHTYDGLTHEDLALRLYLISGHLYQNLENE
jgi:hypothetical protein